MNKKVLGKKISISTEVGKIDEELTRKDENNQSKSHDLEILESNEDIIMEEVEDNFTMDIRTQSDDEFTKLKEENDMLKKELYSIQQLLE